MRLTELTEWPEGQPDPDIKGLTADSREVREGWLFAALPGARADGRQFIQDAIRQGAAAILAPPGTFLQDNDRIALVTDENPRRRLARMAARFYGAQPETIAAVTGTNGKTSTADFTRQIWQALGRKAASLGTLGVRGPGVEKTGSLTTPDPVGLHAALADLAGAGITHLAMEASSHGLHQNRLDGVRVRVAGFTNLTHDHLDYHGTFEDYLAAKAHLFSDILMPGGTAVLNADVPEYPELVRRVEMHQGRVLSYGCFGDYLKLVSLEPLPHGQAVVVRLPGNTHEFTVPLVGAFQVMNLLCAAGMVLAEDPDDPVLAGKVMACLPELKGVPGRLQLVPGPGRGAVYVDYAHTPDALENILKALRPHTKGRLFCLIGCGGDRDPTKRPVMGRLAAELADVAVITDDNPRSEDPAKIRAAMMAAAPGAKEIAGRRAAIAWAVSQLGEGDVLAIAGKGHERGQIIGGRVEPFDDVEEAQKAMGKAGVGK